MIVYKWIPRLMQNTKPEALVFMDITHMGPGNGKYSHATDHMIGESEEIRKVRGLIELVAPSHAPVLILGETGTGKELIARAIHAQSPRREAPLVALNASTLQESILESEFFGYKKGAFTDAQSDKKGLLEVANNGTCFIDEIGDMGLRIQAKLLRVIESGVFMKLGDTRETKIDARFLFATNKDLTLSVENGSFRKDLFYRINTFPIKAPSLRERKRDISLLTNYFLKRFSQEDKCLSKEAAKLLAAYDWPGNVRELANVIQRSILVSGSRNTIVPDDFTEGIHHPVTERNWKGTTSFGEASLAINTADHVAKVLTFMKGNKAETARLLGISRSTLYRKLGHLEGT
jgi:two-component system NtrC family response regulator